MIYSSESGLCMRRRNVLSPQDLGRTRLSANRREPRAGDQVRQQVIATLGRFEELQASGRATRVKLTGDVRHDGAGLDGVHRATAVPDASSASGHYGTGNPLEKIANTGHIFHRRRRHPANVS